MGECGEGGRVCDGKERIGEYSNLKKTHDKLYANEVNENMRGYSLKENQNGT